MPQRGETRVEALPNTATVTTGTLDFPTGVVADDVLFRTWAWNGSPGTVTPPAGWNLLYMTSSTVSNPKMAVYWQRAAEPMSGADTWTWTSTIYYTQTMTAWSGMSTSATPTVEQYESSVAVGSATFTGATVAVNALLFYGVSTNSSSATWQPGSAANTGTFTELADAAGKSHAIGALEWATGGDTGAVTVPRTSSTAALVGAFVTMAPGVAGPAPVNTEARMSLTDPSANPTGTQTVRALVRKVGAGGNPSARVEVWENGGAAPIATPVANTQVTSADGQVLAGTFPASVLTVASGVPLELRVVGTGASDGTVEVGAIRVIATISGGPPSWLAPDGIISMTNLSGVLASIQDDPDAPDTSWLTAP